MHRRFVELLRVCTPVVEETKKKENMIDAPYQVVPPRPSVTEPLIVADPTTQLVLAQIKVTWTTVQPPRSGFAGLLADVKSITKDLYYGKVPLGPPSPTFRAQAFEALRQCRRDFHRELEQVSTALADVTTARRRPSSGRIREMRRQTSSSSRASSAFALRRWVGDMTKRYALLTALDRFPAAPVDTLKQPERAALGEEAPASIGVHHRISQFLASLLFHVHNGLHPYTFLRNASRRAHACCALLCFPCVLRFSTLGDLPPLFEFADARYEDPAQLKRRLDRYLPPTQRRKLSEESVDLRARQVGPRESRAGQGARGSWETESPRSCATSIGSESDLDEMQFHSLQSGGELDTSIECWDPRVVLYGGAMYASQGAPRARAGLLHGCMYSLESDPMEPIRESDADIGSPTTSRQKPLRYVFRLQEAKITQWTMASSAEGQQLFGEERMGGPESRYGASTVAYRGRLYVFGGAGEAGWREPTLFNDLWVLTPDTRHSRAYIWREVPLKTAAKPPSCAFHLAVMNAGHMYVWISGRVVGETLNDRLSWVSHLAEADQELISAELNRSRRLGLRKGVLDAYKRRLERSVRVDDQLWKIDLEARYPEWEQVETTTVRNLPAATQGGLALASHGDRLFAYGVLAEDPQLAVGVLDLRLRAWVAWVCVPGAPICVSAVPIGKLWILLGQETWGIFNFETFEWRCDRKPSKAQVRYGCSAVWLPPYLPFEPSFNRQSLSYTVQTPHRADSRRMHTTDPAALFFWLLQQGRRPGDNRHTILLIGGFTSTGQLTNQVDQLTLELPPELAENCFAPLSPDADLLYASLFGEKLKDERLYGREVVLYRKGEALELRQRLEARSPRDVLCARLAEEATSLRRRHLPT